MNKKSAIQLSVYSFIIISCTSISIFTSCALPAAPDGGARDTEPPKIIFSSVPQSGTNVQANKLIWTFDEYFVLKSPSQNINSSPPLPQSSKFETRGKSFIISWEGDLIPNSTYVLQWGAAISDLHEGNVIKGIQWVFSTGPSLDSGEVLGQIIDPWTGLPRKDVAVCLYPEKSSNDSAVFKPALYSTRTNDSGFFRFEHISKNKIYDIRSFEDPDGNNRLSPGELKPIAYLKKINPHEMDTVHSKNSFYQSIPLLKSGSVADSVIKWSPWGPDTSGILTLKYIIGCDTGSYREGIQIKPIILELKGKEGVYAQWTSSKLCDSNTVTVSGLPPGKYELQAIYDRNSDGKLNSGDYWKKEDPESRISAKTPIEIKANWTMETRWEINRTDPVYKLFH
tara:strand:+ start:853 stop:2040 length:1188 start_codon:yes stop_codon:yes gene_type:complete